MFRYLILLLITFQFTSINAQDTTAFPGTVKNSKVGVYKTYAEFLTDNPSIQKELKIVVD
jgi:hypothetical protein